MSKIGKVRIGHKAPDFHCDAVTKGIIQEVSLSTYITPLSPNPPWLILLFIPAAFSFVCPTEVLAFHNCVEEFRDRHCEVLFVSVDTKHSLWHWQNMPKQYGGLGNVEVSLLSDASHRMSKDYGVLVEEEGVCLRGMFILDGQGVVQHTTLNNTTVGRSVLEALRLLEAFQAVARHGVLCPIDWKPNTTTSDSTDMLSNTLTESYADRLRNLQIELGQDVLVTNLDAKYKDKQNDCSKTNGPNERARKYSSSSISGSNTSLGPASRDQKKPSPDPTAISNATSIAKLVKVDMTTPPASSPIRLTVDCPPHGSAASTRSSYSCLSVQSASAPQSPIIAPNGTEWMAFKKGQSSQSRTTARHARGQSTAPTSPYTGPMLRSPAQTRRSQGHNTYESRRGSQVILEFADPTYFPRGSAPPTPATLHLLSKPHLSHGNSYSSISTASSPTLSLQTSVMQSTTESGTKGEGKDKDECGGGPTRLQSTFEAIKKMSAGLASQKNDFSPKSTAVKEARTPGYFDAVVEGEGDS